MTSTDHHPRATRRAANASKLAGYEASFKHWHFCDLEPGHEGKHRCMCCKVEFDR